MSMRSAVAAILPVTMTFSMAAGGAMPPQKGPFVDYKYPSKMALLGGPSEKKIDCGTIIRLKSEPNTLYASCDFLEQADNNGQEICNVTDGITRGTSQNDTDESIKAAAASATLYGFRHFGSAHKICRKQAGTIDSKTGKTKEQINGIYGTGWESDSDCPIIDIRNACRAAMGLAPK